MPLEQTAKSRVFNSKYSAGALCSHCGAGNPARSRLSGGSTQTKVRATRALDFSATMIESARRSSMSRLSGFVALFISLVSAIPAFSQEFSASITAQITDPSGAPFTLRTFPTRFPDVRSKPLNVVEFSAYKEIPIRERLRWQIRADFHNALNHPFFDRLASNDVANAQFVRLGAGAIDDTSQPRLIVIAMQIVF